MESSQSSCSTGTHPSEPVALVRYQEPVESMRTALDLIGGLEWIGPGQKVVLKPNMAWSARPPQLPPGVCTTPDTIEDLIVLLKERGVKDIVLAEGAVHLPDLHVTTASALKWSGIDAVLERHAVPCVDLNEGPFDKVECVGYTLEVARLAREADVFINVPVMKTHMMTRTSLGMKNLKGCLSMAARKIVHQGGLHNLIAILPSIIPSHLTVVDGLWALEGGPLSGNTYRKDVIVASRDVYAADVVAGLVMGQQPAHVQHLVEYAQRNGRSLDPGHLEIRGEDLSEVSAEINWFRPVVGAIFKNFGLTSYYDPGLHPLMCSFCSIPFGVTSAVFGMSNQGLDLQGLEVIGGPTVLTGRYPRALLIGKCGMDANPQAAEAAAAEASGPEGAGISVAQGCPPKLNALMEAYERLLPEDLRKAFRERMVAAFPAAGEA